MLYYAKAVRGGIRVRGKAHRHPELEDHIDRFFLPDMADQRAYPEDTDATFHRSPTAAG
ncbi:MAG: hypothetical protein AAGK37_15585 [Pseudomonadota bacterium]